MLKRLPIAAMLALVTGAASAQQNPSFYLVNRSSSPINAVFATPTGVPNWGRDRLGDDVVAPGRAYPIRLYADGHCLYDIRVVYGDGRAEERRGLNTCALDNISFPSSRPAPAGNTQQAAASDPSFRLVNRGRVEIDEVYASPAGMESWGEDRLGEDIVPAGTSRIIALPNGPCLYDIRVVFIGGAAVERRRINLCSITDLRVP